MQDTGLQKDHPDHDAAVGSLVLVGQGDVQLDTLRAWVEAVAIACWTAFRMVQR